MNSIHRKPLNDTDIFQTLPYIKGAALRTKVDALLRKQED